MTLKNIKEVNTNQEFIEAIINAKNGEWIYFKEK